MSEQDTGEAGERLFEKLGGAEGVQAIINDMYQRVLADPMLSPFFEKVPMDRLRRMQYQFIASALDGPVEYTGAELNAIHRGRGIAAKHFAKFCGHFADAVEAHGASKDEVDRALGRLATYKDKITGEANVDG
jgi:hemoglobin